MSDQFKIKLISWGNTFLATFILTVATSLTMVGAVEWTSAFWIPIAVTAIRAAIAEVVKTATPVRLGGKK